MIVLFANGNLVDYAFGEDKTRTAKRSTFDSFFFLCSVNDKRSRLRAHQMQTSLRLELALFYEVLPRGKQLFMIQPSGSRRR